MDILPQLLVNAIISGSIYALASSGLALTYGLLRLINFAHGHLMMAGAYIFFWLYELLGYSFPVATILSVVLCALLAEVSLRIFVSPFAGLSMLLPLVTTLALANLLESGVAIAFGVNVRSLSLRIDNTSLEFGGVFVTPVQLLIVALALVSLFTLGLIVHATPLGRRARALGHNKHAAQSVGVNERAITRLTFHLGVILAALAGVAVGFETNLQPTMGNAYTIKAFAAMMLGGLGNLWGTLAGSYLLGLVENLSIGIEIQGYSIPAGYKDAFAFVMILFVLLFRPQGIFNTRSRTV